MQKCLILALIVVVVSFGYAQTDHRTTLRAGKHPNFIRVVFSSSPEVITNASVMLHKENSIRVDLKSSSEVEVQPIGVLKNNSSAEPLKGLTVASKDNVYYLTYNYIEDIKVSKLSNPHRLVIDIITTDKKNTEEQKNQNKLTEDNSVVTTSESVSGKIETLIIDPGHGGDDRGINSSRFAEKEFVLSFAKELSVALNKRGVKTILTRKQDQYLSLRERQHLMQGRKYDMILSLHTSDSEYMVLYALGGENSNPKRIDTFYGLLQANIGKTFNIRMSDIVPSMFPRTTKPAFLIELPNPDVLAYDRKTKELLLGALVSAVTAMDRSLD